MVLKTSLNFLEWSVSGLRPWQSFIKTYSDYADNDVSGVVTTKKRAAKAAGTAGMMGTAARTMERERERGFARHADDELNEERKVKELWNDPAAAFPTVCISAHLHLFRYLI